MKYCVPSRQRCLVRVLVEGLADERDAVGDDDERDREQRLGMRRSEELDWSEIIWAAHFG